MGRGGGGISAMNMGLKEISIILVDGTNSYRLGRMLFVLRLIRRCTSK